MQSVAFAQITDGTSDRCSAEPSLVPERNILPHGESLHQAEVLMDHADTQRGGNNRVRYLHTRAVDEDGARVGHDQPDEHLHEGGLSGPVLTQDTVDLSPVDFDVDRVAGGYSTKVLAQQTCANGRWGPHRSGTPTIKAVVRPGQLCQPP